MLVLTVLLLGLSGAWRAERWIETVQDRHSTQMVRQHAIQIRERANSEIRNYVDGLAEMAAAAGSHTDFTAGDFTALTDWVSYDRLPGVDYIHYVMATDDAGVPALQEWGRRQGATNLVLDSRHQGIEHFFVVFSRVVVPKLPAVPGRDLGWPGERAEALRLAGQHRAVYPSRSYQLPGTQLDPTDRDAWFVDLVAPVVAAPSTPDASQLRGWILLRIRVKALLSAALGGAAHSDVNIRLLDLSGGTPGQLVGALGHSTLGGGVTVAVEQIKIGERQWRLEVAGNLRLLSAIDQQVGRLVFGVVVLLTVLIAALVAVLAGARSRALAKVDEATAALRVDIERRKQTEALLREREAQLRHLAFHDPLTGLANRALFSKTIAQAIARKRFERDALAVLYIDLDGFKAINDELGHDVGDAVLVQVAARLRECVRIGDTVARLGGDEFAVLTEGMKDAEQITAVADRIVPAVAKPYDVDGQRIAVTGSIGISIFDRGVVGLEQLLREADNAMYEAKTSGKNRYVIARSDHVVVPDEVFAGFRAPAYWRGTRG